MISLQNPKTGKAMGVTDQVAADKYVAQGWIIQPSINPLPPKIVAPATTGPEGPQKFTYAGVTSPQQAANALGIKTAMNVDLPYNAPEPPKPTGTGETPPSTVTPPPGATSGVTVAGTPPTVAPTSAPEATATNPLRGTQQGWNNAMERMNEIARDAESTRNQIMTLVKAKYDNDVSGTPDFARLPPNVQDMILKGNQDEMDWQIASLMAQQTGRATTLVNALKYSAEGYQADVDALAQKQAAAQTAINNWLNTYGSNLGAAGITGEEIQNYQQTGVMTPALASKMLKVQTLQETKDKTAEGYTLSPGQVRFDSTGKQVASVPKDGAGGDMLTLKDVVTASAAYGDPEAAWERFSPLIGMSDTAFADAQKQVGGVGGGMRTDRHNNPTAMTTAVAKELGLAEGTDYVAGDAFDGGVTAKLIGDPMEVTIRALDGAARDTSRAAFYTKGNKLRWNYIGMTDAQWLALTPEQKQNVVRSMYKREGGDGSVWAATKAAALISKDEATRVAEEKKVATEIKKLVDTVQSNPASYDVLSAEQKQKIEAEMVARGIKERGTKSQDIDEMISAVDLQIKATDAALAGVSWGSTGIVGQITDFFGGSPAHNLREVIKTLQSKDAFDALQKMRDASKTGAALGSVSDKELELLMSSQRNLKPTQSTDIVMEQLKGLKQQQDNVRAKLVKEKEKRDKAASAAAAGDGTADLSEFIK